MQQIGNPILINNLIEMFKFESDQALKKIKEATHKIQEEPD